jgi:hypothetical protein
LAQERVVLSQGSMGTAHATRGAQGSIFSGRVFLSGRDYGAFPGGELVTGLSSHFRSPRNRLGISVEKLVLEVAGLDSGSGLVLGESFSLSRFRSAGFNYGKEKSERVHKLRGGAIGGSEVDARGRNPT